MNIYFRVDSSLEIGSGHMMRCLALAEALREKGAKASFICRDLPGNLCSLIEKRGFMLYHLPFNHKIPEDKKKSVVKHAGWLGVSWEIDAIETRAILINETAQTDWLIVDHYALDRQWENNIRPYVKKIMIIDDLAGKLPEAFPGPAAELSRRRTIILAAGRTISERTETF